MSRFGPRDGGDRTVLPASELGLDVPDDVPRVDYVVTETDGETFKLGSAPPFEPFTVQPGKVGVLPVMPDKIPNTAEGRIVHAGATDVPESIHP